MIAKNALDYVEFVKKYFNKDIIDEEGLFIIPLGFKLPFQPEDYLSKASANYHNSPETQEFIQKVVKVIENLHESAIEDSVVLGFNIYLESVKKQKNSDLLVAITNREEAQATIAHAKQVRISNEPGVAKVSLSEDQLLGLFPLTYQDVLDTCKKRYSDCKFNNQFHEIMNTIKQNPNLAFGRKLNPKKKGDPDKIMYSNAIFKTLDQYYTMFNTTDR